MRKPGYYWAKHLDNERSEEEVISIADDGTICRLDYHGIYNESNFCWIADEPIPVQKQPKPLVHDNYYTVKYKGSEEVFVARYHSANNLFSGMADIHSPTNLEILGGPMTITEVQRVFK